jgi:hypothetical protein
VADDLRANLKLDLSAVQAQLEQVATAQTTVAQKTEVVEQRGVKVAAQIEATSSALTRIEQRIARTVRSLARAGLATALGSSLEELLPDTGVAGALGRIGSDAITGAAFGGAPGAAFGAAFATIRELSRVVRGLSKQTTDLAASVRENRSQVLSLIAALEQKFEENTTRSAVEQAKDLQDLAEEVEELTYQASQYVE